MLRIKNEEAFFQLKVKGINLLQEFGVTKEESEGMNHLHNESEVFEYIINKLKLRIKDYRSKEKFTN